MSRSPNERAPKLLSHRTRHKDARMRIEQTPGRSRDDKDIGQRTNQSGMECAARGLGPGQPKAYYHAKKNTFQVGRHPGARCPDVSAVRDGGFTGVIQLCCSVIAESNNAERGHDADLRPSGVERVRRRLRTDDWIRRTCVGFDFDSLKRAGVKPTQVTKDYL
jgi:hypothetical protein